MVINTINNTLKKINVTLVLLSKTSILYFLKNNNSINSASATNNV
ncbi:hypothetical protein JCM19301_2155 [Jejuia pallidilutea]|uniref:Uncharacterized protein n=1 Tax=Jejuia pallidilutea TaxID=504487 RepID=A0A090VQK0_9FLAO|nr:hypothetical protein JCM19301_2155 [Jejuia pallidilutea]